MRPPGVHNMYFFLWLDSLFVDCSSAGTISSVCSCVVCSNEYSVTGSESGPAKHDPGPATDTVQVLALQLSDAQRNVGFLYHFQVYIVRYKYFYCRTGCPRLLWSITAAMRSASCAAPPPTPGTGWGQGRGRPGLAESAGRGQPGPGLTTTTRRPGSGWLSGRSSPRDPASIPRCLLRRRLCQRKQLLHTRYNSGSSSVGWTWCSCLKRADNVNIQTSLFQPKIVSSLLLFNCL